MLVIIVGGAGLVLAFSSRIAFMRSMDMGQKVAVALMTAAIFLARSPSSAIALINELRAKGPFVQTALGVTMVGGQVSLGGCLPGCTR